MPNTFYKKKKFFFIEFTYFTSCLLLYQYFLRNKNNLNILLSNILIQLVISFIIYAVNIKNYNVIQSEKKIQI